MNSDPRRLRCQFGISNVSDLGGRLPLEVRAVGTELAFQDTVLSRILLVRGHRVLLDSDLAGLYGVETSQLVRAVKRNIERFPDDFMFQLTPEEFVRINPVGGTRGGRRYAPYVFTEQGVAMLSSVLRSERAVAVNVEIMRAFVRLRSELLSHEQLTRRLDELESKYDEQFAVVFTAIRQLMSPPDPPPRHRIGFRPAEAP